MTKLTYDADFRITVHPETWEYDGPDSRFFVGIYTVSLNSHVQISFVPDVSDVCPPWRDDVLPNGQDVSSEREARLLEVLTSDYSVTPNARLAGQDDVFELPPFSAPADLDPWGAEHSGPTQGVVWYVTPGEWEPLVAELEGLTEWAYSEVRYTRFSQIGPTRLAQFLEDRFLPSGRLSARHLEILRRA